MQYAILRVQKLKSAVAVHRSMKHAFRAQDTPNADPALTPDNTHIGAQNVTEGMAAFRARLPEKFRKDAVQCVEYLMTASPEVMQAKSRDEQDAYFRDSLEWLKKRHGSENVIYAGIHRDEKTPHMYAYVVPRDPESGRLNAKRWLGGARALRDMQTEFVQDVGQQHGLERGIEGSKAKHTTIKQHYAAISKPVPKPEFRPESVQPKLIKKAGLMDKLRGKSDEVESPEAVAKRLSRAMHATYEPVQEKAKRTDLEARRASEMAQTARILGDEKKRLEGALEAEKRRNDRQRSRYKVLDELAQANPDAVKSLLSQARAQVDLAKIREEFVRRVIDLPKLASEGIGAVRTFAMRGVSALTSWGGMDKVNWKQVEVDTYYDHADRPVEALDAIIAHSPRMADPAVRTAQEGVRDRVIKAQQEAELRAAQQAEEQRARQEAIRRERQEAERRAAPQKPRPRPR